MRIFGIILALIILILIIWLIVSALGTNNIDQSDVISEPTVETTETFTSTSPVETFTSTSPAF